MKIIFLLTIFCSTIIYGQNKNLHFYIYQNGDTSGWYKSRIELGIQLELDKIQNAQNYWQFRLWTDRQAIDIWIDSNKNVFGKLTSWTVEYNNSGDNVKKSNIFFENKNLEMDQINKIILLYDKYQINTIPDDHSINKWGQGFDGITYIIEASNLTDYDFKTYWTPTAQDSLKEAIVIQAFVDSCLVISNADTIWADFSSRIPFQCYINDGPMITCKGVYKEKNKRRKKNHS